MLDDIREREKATFFARNTSELLCYAICINAFARKSIHLLEEFVSMLFVAHVHQSILIRASAETERTFCDVFTVIVVDSCCTDAFVLVRVISGAYDMTWKNTNQLSLDMPASPFVFGILGGKLDIR